MGDFGTVREHAGNKDHRCEWCGQAIPRGEKFAHFTGMWDSEFQDWRMHLECHASASLNDELQDGFTPFSHSRGSMEER